MFQGQKDPRVRKEYEGIEVLKVPVARGGIMVQKVIEAQLDHVG